jgi:EAL domain-containing protein (putative c-di-GMP-specific phosphodiesterase class I)
MTVVGEGIETDGQLDNLVAMECDEGQGFAFAPPLKATEIAALGAAAHGAGAGGAGGGDGSDRRRTSSR